MKSLSLYELSNEFCSLEASMLSSMNEETGEIDESFIEELNSLEMLFKDKAINVAKYIENLKSSSEGLKVSIQKAQKRKKSMDNMVDRLNQYLVESMRRLKIFNIDGNLPIKLKSNPEKLVIDDESLIPSEYFCNHPVLDKKTLKSVIKAEGKKIEGVHLEKGMSVRIG